MEPSSAGSKVSAKLDAQRVMGAIDDALEPFEVISAFIYTANWNFTLKLTLHLLQIERLESPVLLVKRLYVCAFRELQNSMRALS